MAALEALLDALRGRWGIPAGPGDRPFRCRAGAQGRSGTEVRLAAPGAGRAVDLARRDPARRRRLGGVPRGGASASATARPKVTGARCSRRFGCAFVPWRKGNWPPRTLPGRGRSPRSTLALTTARFSPRRRRARMAGWPRPRGRGKSGLQGDMAAGNARPGQPEGKRHRDQTAPAASAAGVRVKRWGKSPPRRRRRRRHGKPRQEQGQIGIARGSPPGFFRPSDPGWPPEPAGNGGPRGMVIGPPSGGSQNPAYRPSARQISRKHQRRISAHRGRSAATVSVLIDSGGLSRTRKPDGCDAPLPARAHA